MNRMLRCETCLVSMGTACIVLLLFLTDYAGRQTPRLSADSSEPHLHHCSLLACRYRTSVQNRFCSNLRCPLHGARMTRCRIPAGCTLAYMTALSLYALPDHAIYLLSTKTSVVSLILRTGVKKSLQQDRNTTVRMRNSSSLALSSLLNPRTLMLALRNTSDLLPTHHFGPD